MAHEVVAASAGLGAQPSFGAAERDAALPVVGRIEAAGRIDQNRAGGEAAGAGFGCGEAAGSGSVGVLRHGGRLAPPFPV